jgi:hypothetical protein
VRNANITPPRKNIVWKQSAPIRARHQNMPPCRTRSHNLRKRSKIYYSPISAPSSGSQCRLSRRGQAKEAAKGRRESFPESTCTRVSGCLLSLARDLWDTSGTSND